MTPPATAAEGASEATADGMLEAVGSDQDLEPAERETAIGFSRAVDVATLFTADPGIMRRVLGHPHAAITALTLARGDRSRPRVSPEEWNGDRIVGVHAALPVGALSVKHKPRKSGSHAAVVTEAGIGQGAIAQLPDLEELPGVDA